MTDINDSLLDTATPPEDTFIVTIRMAGLGGDRDTTIEVEEGEFNEFDKAMQSNVEHFVNIAAVDGRVFQINSDFVEMYVAKSSSMIKAEQAEAERRFKEEAEHINRIRGNGPLHDKGYGEIAAPNYHLQSLLNR
jgi:hypothetical protein